MQKKIICYTKHLYASEWESETRDLEFKSPNLY